MPISLEGTEFAEGEKVTRTLFEADLIFSEIMIFYPPLCMIKLNIFKNKCHQENPPEKIRV